MLKTFYVFNVQQIDGLERIPTPELERNPIILYRAHNHRI